MTDSNWRTFRNLFLGGSLLGGGAASLVSLLRQYRASQADDPATSGLLPVELPAAKKTPEAAEGAAGGVVKSALTVGGIPGVDGALGLGAGVLGGMGMYNLIRHLTQEYRNSDLKDEAAHAKANYLANLQKEIELTNPDYAKTHEAVTKSAANSAPSLTEMANWGLVGVAPLWMYALQHLTRTALDKTFPMMEPERKRENKEAVITAPGAATELPHVDPAVKAASSTGQMMLLSQVVLDWDGVGPAVVGLVKEAASRGVSALEAELSKGGVDSLLRRLESEGAAAKPELGPAVRAFGVYRLSKSAALLPTFKTLLAAEITEMTPTRSGLHRPPESEEESDAMLKFASDFGDLLHEIAFIHGLQELGQPCVVDETVVKEAVIASDIGHDILNAVIDPKVWLKDSKKPEKLNTDQNDDGASDSHPDKNEKNDKHVSDTGATANDAPKDLMDAVMDAAVKRVPRDLVGT